MWAGLKPVEFEEYKSELESSGNTRQEIKHLMSFILKCCHSLILLATFKGQHVATRHKLAQLGVLVLLKFEKGSMGL